MWNHRALGICILIGAVVSGLLVSVVLVPHSKEFGLAAVLDASTDQASSTPSVGDVLDGLQAQVQNLTFETQYLQAELAISKTKSSLPRALSRGDSGTDVTLLQTLLAQNTGTTSSVTGFYGSATEKSIKDFQKQAGIKITGAFDSATRDAFFKSMEDQAGGDLTVNTFIPLDLTAIASEPSVADLTSQVSTLSSEIVGLQSSISDLASRVTTLESGSGSSYTQSTPVVVDTAPPPPSLPAITMTSVTATSIARTSAVITWTTNNQSNNEVDYSTSSTLAANQLITSVNPTMVTSHSITLSSLVHNTKYYYRVTSVDASGNVATSAILNFTTLN